MTQSTTPSFYAIRPLSITREVNTVKPYLDALRGIFCIVGRTNRDGVVGARKFADEDDGRSIVTNRAKYGDAARHVKTKTKCLRV